MQHTAPKPCPNCAASLSGTDQYCPNCGQQTHLHRFNLPHIGHELFHAFTHADKGVLHLIASLTLRPGKTAREYVLEGKRKRYFNPFTFLLLVLGFSVLVNSYYKPYGRTPPPTAQNAPAQRPVDSVIRERQQAVFAVLNKRANLVALAALPVFALVFWLFFIRSGINYAEHLVANVFFAGYFQLFAALASIVLGLLHQPSLFTELQLGFQLIYLPIAYYQFLNYNRPINYLLTFLACVLAIGVWGALTYTGIRFYIGHGL